MNAKTIEALQLVEQNAWDAYFNIPDLSEEQQEGLRSLWLLAAETLADARCIVTGETL